jgi:putative transposase
VSKARKGGYVPFFILKRWPSVQALIAVVQEAFVNGVSTRKIERLARTTSIENISTSHLSEFNKELDALYQKLLVEGLVVSVAVMIACGANKAGTREILTVEPRLDESEDSWRTFFRELKTWGMKRTALWSPLPTPFCRPRSGRNGQAPAGSVLRLTS